MILFSGRAPSKNNDRSLEKRTRCQCHKTFFFVTDAAGKWRYETEHNDIQQNDTQHNDTQHNDTQHNDTQHNSE
jgi:hypothetical protein